MVFDFLTKSIQSAFGGGDTTSGATRPPRSPPAPKTGAQGDGPMPEADPGALAAVFAGLVDGGGGEETYGAAPAMAAPRRSRRARTSSIG